MCKIRRLVPWADRGQTGLHPPCFSTVTRVSPGFRGWHCLLSVATRNLDHLAESINVYVGGLELHWWLERRQKALRQGKINHPHEKLQTVKYLTYFGSFIDNQKSSSSIRLQSRDALASCRLTFYGVTFWLTRMLHWNRCTMHYGSVA